MTREQIDAYWDEHRARIVDDYASFRTDRSEMMRQLRDLASAIDTMMKQVEAH